MPGVSTDRKVTQVWLSDQSGHIRPIPIATGIADSLFTEVTDQAVKEGDTVIVGIETLEEQAQKKLPPGFDMGPKMR